MIPNKMDAFLLGHGVAVKFYHSSQGLNQDTFNCC